MGGAMRSIWLAAAVALWASVALAAGAAGDKAGEPGANGPSQPASAAAQNEDMGSWQVTGQPSALEKASSQATAILASTNTMPNAVGVPANAKLIYRCGGDGTSSVYIDWPAFVGLDVVQVRTKAGTSSIESAYWKTSTDGLATFATMLDNRITRLSALFLASGPSDHTIFVARVEPENYPAQEAQFDIAGGRAAIETANRLCDAGGPGSAPAARPANAPTGEPALFGVKAQDRPGVLRMLSTCPSTRGAFLLDVTPGGVANAGGLKGTDTITSFDGKPINGKADLDAAIKSVHSGQVVSIDISGTDCSTWTARVTF